VLRSKLRRLASLPGTGFRGVETEPDAGPGPAPAFGAGPSEAEAEVVKGDRLRAIPVGSAGESAFTAFVDGIQRSRVVLYHGAVPIVHAYAAAVIRERRDRRLATLESCRADGFGTRYLEEREAVFFPFRLLDPETVVAAGLPRDRLIDTSPPAGEPLPLFPPLLYARAEEAVNRWRESLEIGLATRWCREGTGWLLVDGGLTLSPELAASTRAVGVIKSHTTRFFDGDDARTLLGLEAGERTSVFRPGTRHVTPVYSWYLRLRSPARRDILWGLVRVEVAAHAEMLDRADEISRWLLAETSPLALPDPRWDRLLYPIRECEEFLRARAPRV